MQLGIKEIRAEVRNSLQQMPSGHLADLSGLAAKFLSQTSNRVNDDLLRAFLTDAQVTQELDSEQLWSFPLLIRIVLIEELVALSCRCSRIQQLREEAFLWADRIAHSSAYGGDLLDAMTVRRLEAGAYALATTAVLRWLWPSSYRSRKRRCRRCRLRSKPGWHHRSPNW